MGMIGGAIGWKAGSKLAPMIGDRVAKRAEGAIQHITRVSPSAAQFLAGKDQAIIEGARAIGTFAAPYIGARMGARATSTMGNAASRVVNFSSGGSDGRDGGIY